MAYWILQANPDIYRIFDALGDADAIRTWTVAHHRQIAHGDEFALWASGPNSGVYAFGMVSEPAKFRPDPDAYWAGPAVASGKQRSDITPPDSINTPGPQQTPRHPRSGS